MIKKRSYEDYITSLVSRLRIKEDTSNEFSREDIVIEDTLSVLKDRLKRFYDNFDEDFKVYSEMFKKEYLGIVSQYISAKMEF